MAVITPSDISTQKLYGLMATAVSPRPIAFASTINKKGEVNLAPFSFFNMMSANPPILVFSPLSRINDNSTKDTLINIKEVAEVVINVVNEDIVHQMSLASANFSAGINEFIKSGLTMEPSQIIAPPRVKESPIQFECKVQQLVKLGEEAGAGTLVVCEVLKMHIQDDYLDEHEKIDQQKLNLVARMGGGWYTKAAEGMFEIPKPISNIGIGIDLLPNSILESSVFRGRELAKLAGVKEIPTGKITIEELEQLDEKTHLLKHKQAKIALDNEKVLEAWEIILS